MLLLAGCTSHLQPEPSQALPAQQSSLGRQVLQLASAQPPGYSGFRLLASSTDAFSARAEMIRAARSSLDIQYYIVHDGLTTRTLVDELFKAADRGVRVRLLLDDTTSDGNDYTIATLAAHPNIHIRVFNPLHVGRSNGVTRLLGRLFDLSRQHRRMHNKLLLADSCLAIVGGRNLGDEYFDADQQINFADIDLLGAGPVATQLSKSFDQYWNHSLSTPIQQFLHTPPDQTDLWRTRNEIRQYLADAFRDDRERYRRVMEYREHLPLRWLDRLLWAPGQALWDSPEKLQSVGEPAPELLLTTQLMPVLRSTQTELTLISAYFVPTAEGVRFLTDRSRSGSTVRILTNSLEATDVPAVHGGYAPYRRAMLEQGVRLFELRRQPGDDIYYSFSGNSESSLHSKAAVIDRQRAFIGSLNFDPRSYLWNTELGILVDSPELAGEVNRLALEGTAPAVSYEVRLVEREGEKRLVWVGEKDGRQQVLEKEPGGIWRRFNAWLAEVIGLEQML
ncbi:phospholipase D family protein [Azomonas macrocytogenes]|nr:phospholipase D family protein [Azomonas macrocytogenes]